jgi:hypothetical protein
MPSCRSRCAWNRPRARSRSVDVWVLKGLLRVAGLRHAEHDASELAQRAAFVRPCERCVVAGFGPSVRGASVV